MILYGIYHMVDHLLVWREAVYRRTLSSIINDHTWVHRAAITLRGIRPRRSRVGSRLWSWQWSDLLPIARRWLSFPDELDGANIS
eukprot:CAMPEP_0119204952 /NCGR_PEP_ID=MMETSP1316-20130426/38833_1 /TAXON_ID=41880 /ORGANISM="Pycnococcus provasolii, Strain RCC2336" /LENGTH=84 /DNA_ID=CAMNT_0007201297 /DNA_START=65 /DNA_END=316 /DNA_ORIENTATION=-